MPRITRTATMPATLLQVIFEIEEKHSGGAELSLNWHRGVRADGVTTVQYLL